MVEVLTESVPTAELLNTLPARQATLNKILSCDPYFGSQGRLLQDGALKHVDLIRHDRDEIWHKTVQTDRCLVTQGTVCNGCIVKAAFLLYDKPSRVLH
jgi:hypothetical protein